MTGKRKLIGAELLGGKTLKFVAGMAVAASIAAADVAPAEASSSPELSVAAFANPSAPGAILLVPSTANSEQLAYHRSHMSHQSHESHHSHQSGRGY
jgi:hypothetical protein